MLWSTLKLDIHEFVEDNPDHFGVQTIKEQASANGHTISGFLDRIDIRNVGKLRDLVPEAFPKSLRRPPLMTYQNNRGQWCISRR